MGAFYMTILAGLCLVGLHPVAVHAGSHHVGGWSNLKPATTIQSTRRALYQQRGGDANLPPSATTTTTKKESNKTPTAPTAVVLHKSSGDNNTPLWIIPIGTAIGSFLIFRKTAGTFHKFMMWISSNTWIASTEAELASQINIITQVVNGPVITSVSILFASLASMTISSLFQRQMDIRKAYQQEIQTLQVLDQWMSKLLMRCHESPIQEPKRQSTSKTITHKEWETGQLLLQEYSKQLNLECDPNVDDRHPQAAAAIGDGYLMAFLKWCTDLKCSFVMQDHTAALAADHLYQAAATILSERQSRWNAISVTFPLVHWVTLTLLATAIAISFLVATDQQDFVFVQGLQVPILWSVLMGSFTSLAVLCYDLSQPFGGAYQVHLASSSSSS